MSWSPQHDEVAATIGLTVGRDVGIEVQVDARFPSSITLVIGKSVAEIMFNPATFETLRDKADDAVREFREAVAARQADAADKRETPELVGATGAVTP